MIDTETAYFPEAFGSEPGTAKEQIESETFIERIFLERTVGTRAPLHDFTLHHRRFSNLGVTFVDIHLFVPVAQLDHFSGSEKDNQLLGKSTHFTSRTRIITGCFYQYPIEHDVGAVRRAPIRRDRSDDFDSKLVGVVPASGVIGIPNDSGVGMGFPIGTVPTRISGTSLNPDHVRHIKWRGFELWQMGSQFAPSDQASNQTQTAAE